jgi:hypothetical protein
MFLELELDISVVLPERLDRPFARGSIALAVRGKNDLLERSKTPYRSTCQQFSRRSR